MDFISNVNLVKLAEMVGNTRDQLYLCLPAIPKIISDSIIKAKMDFPNLEIKLLVDFDPQTFRQGYGEFQAIENLFKAKISVTTLSDNRISFVICDGVGYYLFIESQYLVPAEKETYNAIMIDSVNMVKLKQYFFGSSTKDYTNELSNAIIEVHQELKKLDDTKNLPPPVISKQINDIDQKKVKEELDKNPPLKPIHKRILDIYTNKFQYVDLKFSGVNIKDKEVTVPKDLLPIKNDKLKQQFKTKIKIIEDSKKLDELNSLKELNDNLIKIRQKYFIHSNYCGRNILDIGKKKEFEDKLNALIAKLPEIQKQILESLYSELDKTQERFWKEVFDLVLAEPEIVVGKDSIWLKDVRFIEQAARRKADEVNKRIKWPDYFKLLEKMTINTFYSDITFDDLENKVLLNEFKEKKIITEADANQLAEFSKTVEVTPVRQK